MRLPVLLYHRVGPAEDDAPPSLTLDPQRFRKQLEWLRSHRYRTLSIEDVVAWTAGGPSFDGPGVLLTFDDGYADLARFAFPPLAEMGFRATVFLVTQQLNGGSAPRGAATFGRPLLDADAIRSWSERGIDFGAHTRTHPDLATLDPEQVEHEIVGSQEDLQSILGKPVTAFAYPYGRSSDAAARIVASRFRLAFTVREGLNRRTCDPYGIRRTMVQSNDGPLDLALRMRFGRSPKQDARYRLGKIRRRVRSVLS